MRLGPKLLDRLNLEWSLVPSVWLKPSVSLGGFTLVLHSNYYVTVEALKTY